MKTQLSFQAKWLLMSLILLFLSSWAVLMAQLSSAPAPAEYLRVTLLRVNSNSTTSLVDGNLTNYGNDYSNGLDDDAPKLSNFGENFGILRLGSKLAIEQRKLIYALDTTYFSMWNMQQTTYRMVLTTGNLEHPGLLGFLEDRYLNSVTPIQLNGINNYDFSTSGPVEARAEDRFRILFRNPALVPLSTTFTSISGRFASRKVDLQWTVTQESAIREYVVERSLDRVQFSPVSTHTPYNTPGVRTYTSSDFGFSTGDNFYRVRAVGLNGENTYSSIVKVTTGTATQDIAVYPNPVINKRINLQMSSTQTGRYQLDLFDNAGVKLTLPSLTASGGDVMQTITLPGTLSAGVYRLRILAPDGKLTVKTINVL